MPGREDFWSERSDAEESSFEEGSEPRDREFDKRGRSFGQVAGGTGDAVAELTARLRRQNGQTRRYKMFCEVIMVMLLVTLGLAVVTRYVPFPGADWSLASQTVIPLLLLALYAYLLISLPLLQSRAGQGRVLREELADTLESWPTNPTEEMLFLRSEARMAIRMQPLSSELMLAPTRSGVTVYAVIGLLICVAGVVLRIV